MAGSMNKVILVGRLGQDPKLAYTQSGQAVANFSLATDESYTDRSGDKVEKTEWHRIVCWGKTGELVSNYLQKGSLVLVEGKLQTRKWQDQQGQDRYTTEISAQSVQFMEPKGARGNQAAEDRGQMTDSRGSGGGFPSSAEGMDNAPF